MTINIFSVSFFVKMMLFTGFFTLQSCLIVPSNYLMVIPDKISKMKSNTITWSDFKKKAYKGNISGSYIFSSGVYDINDPVILNGEEYTTLIANEAAIFEGHFDYGNHSIQVDGFVLKRGNIDFHNFSFKNVNSCIRAYKNTELHNVRINGLIATDTHSCILLERGKNLDVNHWAISNIDIQGYYRVAIRLAGATTRNISINNFLINGVSSDSNPSHCFKGGVQIYEAAHHITLQHGRVINNVGDCGSSYQQGDGIEADDRQGLPHHLTFNDLVVENSGDANFDLKADFVTMNNIISLTQSNTRFAYKFWSYDRYLCTRCSAYGNYSYLITLNSAVGTFFDFEPIFDIANGQYIEERMYLPMKTIEHKVPILVLK